ncbi:MAG: ABC transporter permease [Bacteroidia bacterium]|nr:ABC transporter permease [Bacteroidia bacterium]
MNLILLSWRNVLYRPLEALLSLLLISLSVGMVSLLLLLGRQLEGQFLRNIKGIDMVVGAKGSPLQLILSAVYQIDNPTGNIPKRVADSLAVHPMIRQAIPLAYGDNYLGFRIVGTTHAYPAHMEAAVGSGRLWNQAMEVTLGATAAATLGLGIGDTFYSQHGLDGEETHEAHPFEVVGILGATGSVVDQLILTDVSSLWEVHASHEGEEDTTGRAITALLVSFRSPMAFFSLPRAINEATALQAAIPSAEVSRLVGQLLPVVLNTGQGIGLAILLMAGVSMFVSLYSRLRERAPELALMRVMGASRGRLFWLILTEAGWLCVLGYLGGICLARLGVAGLNATVMRRYHYALEVWQWLPEEGLLGLLLLGIGFLAALLPAMAVFRLNISQTLADA